MNLAQRRMQRCCAARSRQASLTISRAAMAQCPAASARWPPGVSMVATSSSNRQGCAVMSVRRSATATAGGRRTHHARWRSRAAQHRAHLLRQVWLRIAQAQYGRALPQLRHARVKQRLQGSCCSSCALHQNRGFVLPAVPHFHQHIPVFRDEIAGNGKMSITASPGRPETGSHARGTPRGCRDEGPLDVVRASGIPCGSLQKLLECIAAGARASCAALVGEMYRSTFDASSRSHFAIHLKHQIQVACSSAVRANVPSLWKPIQRRRFLKMIALNMSR